MITNIEVPTTTDGGPRAFFAGDNLNNANGLAFNQACSLGFAGVCTPSGLSALAIPATALPPTVLIDGTGAAAPTGGPIRWTLCAISGSGLCPATIPDPALVAATFCVSEFGGTACPASVAITAAAQGLSAASAGTPNFSNPFAQVQFWAYNPTAGPTTEGWRLIGTVNAPNSTTDASGACTAVTACSGRNWMFGIVWTPTPGTAFNSAPTIYKIMAIGIMNGTSHPAAAGMSLATPVSAKTVTVFP